MSGSEQMLSLPAELQVFVYSYLPAKDLNAWRLACKERKAFVDTNESILYQSRRVQIAMQTQLGSGEQLICLNLYHKGLVIRLTLVNNVCARVDVTRDKGKTHWEASQLKYASFSPPPQQVAQIPMMPSEPSDDAMPSEDDVETSENLHRISFRSLSREFSYAGLSLDEWKSEATAKFLQNSFEDCVEKLLEKSGGILSLDLTGNFLVEFKQHYRTLLNFTQKLAFCCSRSGISNELLWDIIFAQKRPLFVNSLALTDGYSYERLVDDRFARDSATHELRIDASKTELPLSDAQLLTFVDRSDLNHLELINVTGLRDDGLRAAIQALLNSTMECLIQGRNIVSLSDYHCMETLNAKRGDESINLARSSTSRHYFCIRYQINERVVNFEAVSNDYSIRASIELIVN